ncbi:MAG: DUF4435 domain-containing protein [Gemmataceae bacterium]
MPIPHPTAEELLATLKKTSLPTLLVEGPDDVAIYRDLELEDCFGVDQLNVLPCGGRQRLLTMFSQRAELAGKAVVFLADRDMWVFTEIPEEYEGVIFTTGYSIENDLYAGSEIERLLTNVERPEHQKLLAVVCRWFAFEVTEYRAGREALVAFKVKDVFDPATKDLLPSLIAKRGYTEPDPATVNEVLTNYKLKLRGKTLVRILEYVLTLPNRKAKHHHASLVEQCTKLFQRNVYLQRIINDVQSRFQIKHVEN